MTKRKPKFPTWSKKRNLMDWYTGHLRNTTQYPGLLQVLADDMGVSLEALQALNIGFNFDHFCWAIPERNEKTDIIGIAERSPTGKKLMFKGSKRGLTYAVTDTTKGDRYISGEGNWSRLEGTEYHCPLCGKQDGCLLPTKSIDNPVAAICVHKSAGSIKHLKLGSLHILRPEGNLSGPGYGLLRQGDSPILIPEGMSDVAVAFDLGFTAIGRPSATGGTGLVKKMVAGCDVVIVGENDGGVGVDGMNALAIALSATCKSVVKILPPVGYKDLRSWKSRTELDHDSLLDYIKREGDSSSDPDIFTSDVGQIIARTWLEQEKIEGGHIILRNYLSKWVEYTGNCYEDLEEKNMRGQLYSYLEGKKFARVTANGDVIIDAYKPTRSRINDIIDSLNQWCPIAGSAPMWLTKEPRPDPVNLIAFQNGILDVNEYVKGKIVMHNQSPEFFSFDILPYDFNEDADSPLWEQASQDIFNGRPDDILLLHQWWGYNCVPDMSLDSFMLFTGPSRSGKSTIVETMQAVLGHKLCASTSFQSLAGQFGYQPLVNKYSVIMADARQAKKEQMNAALEKLLTVTGGDPVSVNRKGIKELPTVRLKCRFTIAMNDIPMFTDHSRALEYRMQTLAFKNCYVGREDRSLKINLIRQASEGKLINYALQGLKDLRERGRFITPLNSKIVIQQYRELSSPVDSFAIDCCEMDIEKGYTAVADQVYDAWSGWCLNQGRQPGLKAQFSKWFLAACPGVVSERMCMGGRRHRVFVGVRLSDWVTSEYIEGR